MNNLDTKIDINTSASAAASDGGIGGLLDTGGDETTEMAALNTNPETRALAEQLQSEIASETEAHVAEFEFADTSLSGTLTPDEMETLIGGEDGVASQADIDDAFAKYGDTFAANADAEVSDPLIATAESALSALDAGNDGNALGDLVAETITTNLENIDANSFFLNLNEAAGISGTVNTDELAAFADKNGDGALSLEEVTNIDQSLNNAEALLGPNELTTTARAAVGAEVFEQVKEAGGLSDAQIEQLDADIAFLTDFTDTAELQGVFDNVMAAAGDNSSINMDEASALADVNRDGEVSKGEAADLADAVDLIYEAVNANRDDDPSNDNNLKLGDGDRRTLVTADIAAQALDALAGDSPGQELLGQILSGAVNGIDASDAVAVDASSTGAEAVDDQSDVANSGVAPAAASGISSGNANASGQDAIVAATAKGGDDDD